MTQVGLGAVKTIQGGQAAKVARYFNHLIGARK
jgi:hypothetical protein